MTLGSSHCFVGAGNASGIVKPGRGVSESRSTEASDGGVEMIGTPDNAETEVFESLWTCLGGFEVSGTFF